MESFTRSFRSKNKKVAGSLFLALTVQLSILVGGFSHSTYVPVLAQLPQTASAQVDQAFKNYENENFGLTLSYPPTWTVKEFRTDPSAPRNNSIGSLVVAFNSQPEDANDKFIENVYILVQGPNSTSIKSLEQYTAGSLKAFGNLTNVKIEESGKDTLAGLPASQIIFTTSMQGVNLKKMQVFTVVNNNTAYVATFAAEVSQYNDAIQDFERMVNSIKIDREAMVDVAQNQDQPPNNGDS